MANVQITVVQLLAGEEITNVWYVGGNIDIAAHGQQLADSFRDGYANHLQGSLSNEWSYERIDVRDLDVAGQPSIPFTPTGGSVVGTNTNDRVANQTCLLISPRTNTPRPNRGRKYISGLTQEAMADGVWTAATVQQGIDFVNKIRSDATFIGTDNGLLLCRLDAVSGLIIAANLVSVVVGTNNPATQRKRRLS